MTELTTLISTVGFPIAVAVWYMVIAHKDSKSTQESLNQLTNVVSNNTMMLELIHQKLLEQDKQ